MEILTDLLNSMVYHSFPHHVAQPKLAIVRAIYQNRDKTQWMFMVENLGDGNLLEVPMTACSIYHPEEPEEGE